MKSIVKQFLSYRYHHPRRLFSTIKVSAKDVKTLREQTGAPMMECKKALSHEDVQGDIEKAIDWLRKNGIAAASKRSSKDAAEGLIALSLSPCKRIASVVELNSEKDRVIYINLILLYI